MPSGKGIFWAGSAAGAVNGFFGAGGGMVLVPGLQKWGKLPQELLFPSSLRIMLPICLTSLVLSREALPLKAALPYLIGSGLGGLLAIPLSKKVPTLWLHRVLGLLILLGGGRLLWM